MKKVFFMSFVLFLFVLSGCVDNVRNDNVIEVGDNEVQEQEGDMGNEQEENSQDDNNDNGDDNDNMDDDAKDTDEDEEMMGDDTEGNDAEEESEENGENEDQKGLDGENEDNTDETMAYSLEDVAEHAMEDDCWFVVDGSVYDVTEFIAGKKHPGGAAILEGCGKDATELFNTRPMGSKTPHSAKAKASLENYKIGVLAE